MTDDAALATRPREHTDLSDYLREPFHRLRSEVDRMFDEFPARFPAARFGSRYLASMPLPAVEMTENDDRYRISVEVPGVPHENIDLSIDNDMLVLKGEKQDEREEKERDYSISERTYGSFERRIALPQDAQREGIEARTDNGVIRIEIPRKENGAPERRRIEIRNT